jgi:hypothetical protein
MRRSRNLDMRFHRLLEIATRIGFDIISPGSAYISESELTLLCWIAVAQRMAGPIYGPDSRCLAEVVLRCANALDSVFLRLPPITMYISCFREAGCNRRSAMAGIQDTGLAEPIVGMRA